MSAIGVRITFGYIPAALRREAHSPQLVARAREAAVRAAGPFVQRALERNTPVGASSPGAHQQIVFDPGRAGSGFVGYVGMASKYIGFVESGTRPHWPPRLALTLWAARKFGYPLSSPEAERVGYLVARGISRRGTKAQRFIRRTADEVRPRAQRLMRNAALEVIRGAR